MSEVWHYSTSKNMNKTKQNKKQLEKPVQCVSYSTMVYLTCKSKRQMVISARKVSAVKIFAPDPLVQCGIWSPHLGSLVVCREGLRHGQTTSSTPHCLMFRRPVHSDASWRKPGPRALGSICELVLVGLSVLNINVK